MRKILLTAVFICVAAAVAGADGTGPVNGSEEIWARQQNILYINFVGLVIDQVFIGYVRAITPNISLGANLLYSLNLSDVQLLIYPPITPDQTATYGAGLAADYYIEN